MKHYITAVALAVCLLAKLAFASEDQISWQIYELEKNVYSTYGLGATQADARENAIRNGLQFAVRQLVISDLAIEGDEIIRDTVYSTLNGYIERFDVKVTEKVEGEIYIRAELALNETDIKNTVSIFTNIDSGKINSSGIDGEGIQSTIESALAEQTRKKNQAFFAAKLYEKMYRGYPINAYEQTLEQFEIDKSNPSNAYIKIKLNYSSDWMEHYLAYRQKMGELTKDALPPHDPRVETDFEWSCIVKRQSSNWITGTKDFIDCVRAPLSPAHRSDGKKGCSGFYLWRPDGKTQCGTKQTTYSWNTRVVVVAYDDSDTYLGCLDFSSKHPFLTRRGNDTYNERTSHDLKRTYNFSIKHDVFYDPEVLPYIFMEREFPLEQIIDTKNELYPSRFDFHAVLVEPNRRGAIVEDISRGIIAKNMREYCESFREPKQDQPPITPQEVFKNSALEHAKLNNQLPQLKPLLTVAVKNPNATELSALSLQCAGLASASPKLFPSYVSQSEAKRLSEIFRTLGFLSAQLQKSDAKGKINQDEAGVVDDWKNVYLEYSSIARTKSKWTDQEQELYASDLVACGNFGDEVGELLKEKY